LHLVAFFHVQLSNQPPGLGEDLDLALGFEIGGEAQHRFDATALQRRNLDRDCFDFLVVLVLRGRLIGAGLSDLTLGGLDRVPAGTTNAGHSQQQQGDQPQRFQSILFHVPLRSDAALFRQSLSTTRAGLPEFHFR